MKIGTFCGASLRLIFLCSLIGLTFVGARAEAQTLAVSADGPTTIKLEIRDVYDWSVQEKVGTSWINVLSGGSVHHTRYLTRPRGGYTFRLYNCYPMGGGCSTSSTHSVWLNGPTPPQPASITVTPNVNNNSFAISWPSTSGAAIYRLQSGSTEIYSGANTSHTFSGASANVAYTFAVKACGSYSDCSALRSAPSKTITIPSVPANISVVPNTSNNTFGVSWAASTGTLTHYELTQTGVAQSVNVNGMSTTRDGTPGVATTFTVKACNGMNCSTVRTSTPPSTIPMPTGPEAPVVSGGVTALSITISWTAPSGATEYELKRGTELLAHSGRTYKDTNVVPGNSYTYNVRARNGTGPWSVVGKKTITYPAVPAIPQFTSIAMDGTAVLAKWNAVTNATSYRLVRGTTSWDVSGLQVRDTTVTAGSTYTYKLKACNAAGLCSNDRSQSFAVPVNVPVPAAPTVTASFGGGASVGISWSEPANAASYQLQRNGQNMSFTSNPHRDVTIQANTNYTYTVKACNSNGQCSTAGSAVVFVPEVPLFEVHTTGPHTFSIHVGNVYSWMVEEKVNGAWTTFLSLSAVGLTQTFNYTRPSGFYSFRLYNCYPDGSGCSTSFVRDILLRGTPPPVPTVTPSILDNVAILLEWNQPEGAVTYELRRTDLLASHPPTASGSFPVTSYIDYNVTPGNSYAYHLTVRDVVGDYSTGFSGPIAVPVQSSSSSSVSSSSSSFSSSVSSSSSSIVSTSSSSITSSSSSSSSSSVTSSSSLASSSTASSLSSSSTGTGPVVVNYKYDALGRLTFVEDSQNGNRDYDYDPAGNRLLVSVGGSNDATNVPQAPQMTAGLSSSHIANCAWRAGWARTIGATHYYFKSTQGDSQRITDNTITFNCPDNNPNANKPVWVESCNSIGCGPRANFIN